LTDNCSQTESIDKAYESTLTELLKLYCV